MKKLVLMALAVMSVLIMSCAQAVNGDDPAVSGGIVYEDKNGEVISIIENGKTISNIRNASLVVETGVTDFSVENVKDVTIKNATLDKLTVNSSAELSFVNTQIDELEVNGDLVIKEITGNSASRSARAADPVAQAEKASVVIDKLVMKGNVEAGFGLYKKIERAADKQDKNFIFAEDSTAKVEDYDDGTSTMLGVSPVYEGFDGVKLDLTNKPTVDINNGEILSLAVCLNKDNDGGCIFWGADYSWYGQKEKVVEADYFYWPFLELGESYEMNLTYCCCSLTGKKTILLASKTVTVTPTAGRGEISLFKNEKKGTVDFKENGDIEWTKTPEIYENENAMISYEFFEMKSDGSTQYLCGRTIKANYSKKFDTFNIYKDGFFPKKDSADNKQVAMVFNYDYSSSDKVNGEDYIYVIFAQMIPGSGYTNAITYDQSKYETAFDFELDKANKKIKMTKFSDNAKEVLTLDGANKLWWYLCKNGNNEDSVYLAETDIDNMTSSSEIEYYSNGEEYFSSDNIKIRCNSLYVSQANSVWDYKNTILIKTFDFSSNAGE